MKTLIYAIRFLLRSKSYTLINLLGLAFSLACCIILMRYIHWELNVDTHCVDRNRTCLIVQEMTSEGGILNDHTLISFEQMKYLHLTENSVQPNDIIKQCTFITRKNEKLKHNEQSYTADVFIADSTFFYFFDYPLVEGNARLTAPDDAILTRRFARKIFGQRSPIGEVFFHNRKLVTVRGVIDEPTDKCSFEFDVLLSIHLNNGPMGWSCPFYEFVHLSPHFDMEAFHADKSNFKQDAFEYEENCKFLSLHDAYEQTNPFNANLFLHTNMTYIYLLSGVVLLLLLVGILNFVNIYMVLMMTRSKEYGIKKVFGLQGLPLFIQIWMENLLLIIPALLVAWLLIEITQVPVNRLFQESIGYTWFDLWLSLGFITIMPLLTSIYPYIRYNYRTAITSIRHIGTNRQSVHVRMIFLFVQYILTLIIVIVSLYFGKHLHFLQTTPPGFHTEHILVTDLLKEERLIGNTTKETFKEVLSRRTLVKQKLNECPYIESYIYASKLLKNEQRTFINDKNQKVKCLYMVVPSTFFDIYDIPVIEGQIPTDGKGVIDGRLILNRAAMKAFDHTNLEGVFIHEESSAVIVENPDGNIYRPSQKKPVVAVVEDFYNGHLTQGIKPMIFLPSKNPPSGEASIRVRPGQEKACIDYLREMVREIHQTDDFTYTWLKDIVLKFYEDDHQVTIIYSVFALIGIVVSCLGMFGISLFDIRQRYREIAIRKVNGASMKDLYQLLFKKYLLVLGASFVVAVPIAYYLIHQYTTDFVIKAPMGIGIFVIALLLVALISMGTLWWQTRKAANIDPATVMKKE